MKIPYLSIIIPCYNEERNLRLGTLAQVSSYLTKVKYPYEVIIVDDGSTDESINLIQKFIADKDNYSLLKLNHAGKAKAVISGMKKGKGKYLLFTDMDQATPLREWEKLEPFFDEGYDLVIGSRKRERKGAPLSRRAMARGFMILRSILLDLQINDTQCGFKAFTSESAKKLFNKMTFYEGKKRVSGSTVTAGFDVELLYIAKKEGLKVKEVPVEWHYQETRHVNPIKDSIESIADLIRIRLNYK